MCLTGSPGCVPRSPGAPSHRNELHWDPPFLGSPSQYAVFRLAGDAVTPAMVAGGVIVLAGVYIGALSTPKARKPVPIVREEAAVA